MKAGIEFHVAGELQLKARRPKSVPIVNLIVHCSKFAFSTVAVLGYLVELEHKTLTVRKRRPKQ